MDRGVYQGDGRGGIAMTYGFMRQRRHPPAQAGLFDGENLDVLQIGG
jgi:hypothetical protein